MTETDEKWMQMAVDRACEAASLGEVPIGAVMVGSDGSLLSCGANRTITDIDPTAHAEIVALRSAALKLGNYRLAGTTLYTTIEPCVMSAGALVNARIGRLVYGAADERFGAVDTHFGLCSSSVLNHRIGITSGVMEDTCRGLMQEFFRSRRGSK